MVDLDDFVDLLGADNFAMRAGRCRRAIKFLRERAIKNVVDQRGFSGAGDAGDDREQAERQRDVHVFKIVGAARREAGSTLPFGLRRFSGMAIVAAPAEVLACERFRLGGDLRGLALGDEVAAGVACARAEVHDEIGAADGVFIVLDDEDGVAEIAQMLERAEQARIVAGMQTDGWFVENVENAAKARADLRGEADALRFAAGKSGGGAVQAEIAEADGQQKIEALGDFFERARRRCRAGAK